MDFLRNNNMQNLDIIVAQNVFAHNYDPKGFLTAARNLMTENSLLFVQTSQADMIKNNEFDTIYHEHISFYNINSMNELCKRSCMYIVDVIKCPLHGNSYIFVISKNKNMSRPANIANHIAMEKKAGLLSEQTYINCPGHFGHIELPKPVYNLQFEDWIVKIMKCVCIKCSKLLVNKAHPIIKNILHKFNFKLILF